MPDGPRGTRAPTLRRRERIATFSRSFERGAMSLREWSSRHVRVLAAFAAAAFVVLSVIGFREYSRLDLHPKLWLVAPAAVVGTLLLTLLNAGEYTCGAVLARHNPDFAEAMTVSVAGGAANLLPLPGGFLVRNYAIVSAGATFAGAMGGTVITGVAWIATTAVIVGAIVAGSDAALGVPVVVVGAALLVASAVVILRRVPGRRGRLLLLSLVGVEVLTVAVEVGRYWLVLAALGAHPNLLRTMPFVSASVIATASLVFPGGLGVREALAGGFSAAAGLPGAVGIAASALDRVVVTVMFALDAALLALWRRFRRSAAPPTAMAGNEGGR